MCEPRTTRIVDVINPVGIHLRAATLISEAVRRSNSRVLVAKGGEQVDGTSVLQILSLGAGQGEQLSLEAIGGDAEEVLGELARLFADKFGESEKNTEEAENPQ